MSLPGGVVVTDCLIEAPGWGDEDGPLAIRARVAAAAAVGRARPAAVGAGLPDAELAIVLTDDAAVRGLNAEWRGKDKPTNVLSFPAATPEEIAAAGAGGPPLLLGDVVLALETCRREAEEQGKPLADHIAHLVVHGVLHLLGHDHEDAAEADRMERLEASILGELGIADPYGGPLDDELCVEDARP